MVVRGKRIVGMGGEYEYLQIVRSYREGGQVWQRIIGAALGLRDKLLARGELDGLLCSLAKFNDLLRGAAVQYRIQDRRRILAPVAFTFHGQIEDFQETAMAARDFGTLAAPTGSGKTVMALALIAIRRQPALVVVHNRELADQWIDRIETFLGIPAGEVGRMGGGKKIIGEKITVALVQTLCKCAPEVAPFIGHLIVDECHRCPSRTFTEAVAAFDSHFMVGLSATPWRRDQLIRLIYWQVGDKVHEVDKVALVEAGHVLEAEVIWRNTDFKPIFDPSAPHPNLKRLLQKSTETHVCHSGHSEESRISGYLRPFASLRVTKKSHFARASNDYSTEKIGFAELICSPQKRHGLWVHSSSCLSLFPRKVFRPKLKFDIVKPIRYLVAQFPSGQIYPGPTQPWTQSSIIKSTWKLSWTTSRMGSSVMIWSGASPVSTGRRRP